MVTIIRDNEYRLDNCTNLQVIQNKKTDAQILLTVKFCVSKKMKLCHYFTAVLKYIKSSCYFDFINPDTVYKIISIV